MICNMKLRLQLARGQRIIRHAVHGPSLHVGWHTALA